MIDYTKVPFPYFGGKRDAAPLIWRALGDPAHYVEPFCGSLVTLLLRPHEANRTYFSETVNDKDGLLVNAWRAMQRAPDALAEVVSWPVTELDLIARHLACVTWGERDRLAADPEYYDTTIAGYWLYGICAWIGAGWASGDGAWIVGADGRITKRSTSEPGVSRQRPHLANNGMGVHHAGLREPGVSRQLPHLTSNGSGVHHAGLREPGVSRQRPHLSDDGRGVHRPQLREPGVWHEDDFHPLVMPELAAWFRFLSARLRHVRIVNGDWQRACTSGAVQTLPVRQGKGVAGIFLDPPYGADASRSANLYAHDSLAVASEVRAWCIANGGNPRYRIVLAGFAGEGHEVLCDHGWHETTWYQSGWLKGGMAQQSGASQQDRERLWLSPACLPVDVRPLDALWNAVDEEDAAI